MPGATLSNPMLVRIRTLVAASVLSSPRAEAQSVSFPSADLPEGAALPTSIPVTLSLQRRAVGRVLVTGGGGWSTRRGAPRRPRGGGRGGSFAGSGFGTLTYDSSSARGLSQSAVVGSRAGPPMASGVADAFAALRLLAGHPRIAADRIGIVGFSFGGEVAHLTAFESLRAAMEAGPSRFAAHVATYPAGDYGARAEAGAYTGAPILVLLGEQDANLPGAKVEGYLAYASGARNPAPITTVG